MSNNYSSERYDPALARCTNLALLFDGKHLVITGGRESYEYPAVSGKMNRDRQFNYSRDTQRIASSGAIPEGKYWIRPDELWERTSIKDTYYKIFLGEEGRRRHQEGWGDFRITIHPFTTTVTHEGGGFFIHGGKFPGSAGCIDLTQHMGKFVSDLKKNCFEGMPDSLTRRIYREQ
jgi:hypothetical protein